jgi:superfamily II DNA or RNA helicase
MIAAAAATSTTGPTLRPYQHAAIEAAIADFTAGRRRTLIVLPTGTGKTVVFAELVRRAAARGRRSLVVAHRSELLDQAAAKLAAAGVTSAIEQGQRRAPVDAPCVIASVQTMRGARLERWPADAFDAIVVDEAHHAVSESYGGILSRFARARVVGVTATPDRLDGIGLGEVFESCSYRYELRDAIRDGWLAPITARRVTVDGLDLAAVHVRAGDFDRTELAAAMTNEQVLHGVAAPLLEQAGARRAIVFAVDVAHAAALAEILNRYEPGVARAIDGSASAQARAAALAAYRGGEFRILVNCALFVEGFDEPTIACVAVARPTKSRALYAQMVGRGTRLASGKADCLVLDFAARSRHRLIGPADVLAGRALDDEVSELVNGRIDGDALQLELVLAEAEAHHATAAITAVVRYRTEAIDPFLELPPAAPRHDSGEHATDRQRTALERAGFRRLPDGLTKSEASRWLDALAQRRRLGLASIPQMKLLKRCGVDAKAMTFADASAVLDHMEVTGWKPWR